MKVGDYAETDCTSTVDTFFNLNNYDNMEFYKFASKELVVIWSF